VPRRATTKTEEEAGRKRELSERRMVDKEEER
jgi:hypothetical protein